MCHKIKKNSTRKLCFGGLRFWFHLNIISITFERSIDSTKRKVHLSSFHLNGHTSNSKIKNLWTAQQTAPLESTAQ